MLSLFISTLEMMGLTFVIGFFVAAVIKGIAFWADSWNIITHILPNWRSSTK